MVESNGIKSQQDIAKLKSDLTAAQSGTAAATEPLRQQLATVDAELKKAQGDMVSMLQLTGGFQADIADKTHQLAELAPVKQQLVTVTDEKKQLSEQLHVRDNELKATRDQLSVAVKTHDDERLQSAKSIKDLQAQLAHNDDTWTQKLSKITHERYFIIHVILDPCNVMLL